jgi:hypothetical protein
MKKAAEQETDYINFVTMERNNGFVVLNSGIKDALLLRNGYLKCGWTKRDDITIETYQGLSDEELALLSQDEDVEIVGHSEYPDPFGQGAAMMAAAAGSASRCRCCTTSGSIGSSDRVRGGHAGAAG